jgi:hypothetical protein
MKDQPFPAPKPGDTWRRGKKIRHVHCVKTTILHFEHLKITEYEVTWLAQNSEKTVTTSDNLWIRWAARAELVKKHDLTP